MKRGVTLRLAGLLAIAATVNVRAADGPPTRAVRVSPDVAESLALPSAIDYGGYVLIPVDADDYASLKSSGVEFADDAEGYTLQLGGKSFDPLSLPQARAAAAPSGEPNLQLVQLKGPAKPQWLDDLRAAGLEVVQYIPPYTYVVWGSAAQRSAVQAQAPVRWSGEFKPEFRVLPPSGVRSGRTAARALIYRGADVNAVRAQLTAAGAGNPRIRTLDADFSIALFDIDPAALAELGKIPGVFTAQLVPTDGGLRGELTDQINVNNVSGGNIAFPGYLNWLAGVGLSGAGVVIANVDDGFDQTHPDLVNRVLPCVGSSCGGAKSSLHGTHTAGIMAADGASGVTDGNGFLRGLGVAPGAQLVEQVYSGTYSQPDGMLTLMRQSYQNGAIVSGNSWGPSGTALGYDLDTRQVDIGVRDADSTTPGNQPLVYVLSIDNGYGGTSTQGTPDEAKNVFTIGSTRAQTSGGAAVAAINDVSVNSAHGPALDGRKIPHLVAPGCYVDSTIPGGYTANQCGTSMAAPQVSGAIALFIEYYRNLPETFGDPSPALVKAAFTAVAHDLAGHLDADGGVLGHPFDSKQGWGRMDAEAVLDPPSNVRYFDNPAVLSESGAEWNVVVKADDPLQPMRLMLAWTDAPGHGLGGSTPAWNNDLDLLVVAGANAYRGNVFAANGYSTTGGAADGRNNTEGVFLQSPGGGDIVVHVLATSINSDAIPGDADTTDQDFALVCYNCEREAGFALHVDPAEADICAGDEIEFNVQVADVAGYSDPVYLAASGVPGTPTLEFSVNPVVPSGASTLSVSNTAGVVEGAHTIDIEGASSNGIVTIAATLHVHTTPPAAVSLESPDLGTVGLPLAPTLIWGSAPTALAYTVELAADSSFTTILFSANTAATSVTVEPALDPLTTYFWRVRPNNPCGDGADSAVAYFTTMPATPVLLVDGDDNAPDVRAAYTEALAAAGVEFDVWDTNLGALEPALADLAAYKMVIWFSGDMFGYFDPQVAGPSPSAEAELAKYLDGGGCFYISSQDYHINRGLTTFMVDHLGVDAVTNDQSQHTATGSGSVFGGFGPVDLVYPFDNFSDALTPGAGAQVSIVGDNGTMGVTHDTGVYRAEYWGFPFEAVPTAPDRALLMAKLLDACGALPPVPGDFDGDGDVDGDDFAHWADCMTGPGGGPALGACTLFDFDTDTDVDLLDFATMMSLYVPAS